MEGVLAGDEQVGIMNYLIHEVAQLLGVTGETLRHYEKLGIIEYTRDKNSDYRKCNATDIFILMRSRMYRSYGFTLKETGDLINKEQLPEAADIFRQRKDELLKEIERMNHTVKHLEKYTALLDKAGRAENCFELCERPPLYGLFFRKGDDITRDPQLRAYVSKWMDFTPFLMPFFVYHEYTGKDWSWHYGCGFCLDPEDAAFLQVAEDRYVFRLEPVPCVYSVIKVFRDLSTIDTSLDSLFDKMRARGLVPSGPVYGRWLISLKKSADYHSYTEWWVPYIGPYNAAGEL
jgi:DNA-binding transcriptional MerR regulator